MLPIIGAAYEVIGAAYEVIGAAVVTGAETEVCTCAVMEPVATGAAVTSQQSDRCAIRSVRNPRFPPASALAKTCPTSPDKDADSKFPIP